MHKLSETEKNIVLDKDTWVFEVLSSRSRKRKI
jgi:hypothetical protein